MKNVDYINASSWGIALWLYHFYDSQLNKIILVYEYNITMLACSFIMDKISCWTYSLLIGGPEKGRFILIFIPQLASFHTSLGMLLQSLAWTLSCSVGVFGWMFWFLGSFLLKCVAGFPYQQTYLIQLDEAFKAVIWWNNNGTVQTRGDLYTTCCN